MKKIGVGVVFVLFNLALLFFMGNPWFSAWRDQAIAAFVFELALLVIVGFPVVLYQMYAKKRTLKQSITTSVDAVLDFLSGIV